MRKAHTFELLNVTYEFPGHSKPVLDDFSLRIDDCDYISIVGEPGCGKSCLGSMLACPSQYARFKTHGVLLRDGKNIEQRYPQYEGWHWSTCDYVQAHKTKNYYGDKLVLYNKYELQKISYDLEQFPRGSVLRLLAEQLILIWEEPLAPLAHDIRLFQARHGGKLDAQTRLEFEQESNGYKLSSAQAIWLEIARILSFPRNRIIFDRCGSYLDWDSRKSYLSILRALNCAGCTIVHITENMNEAIEADRVVIMNEGRNAIDICLDDVGRIEAANAAQPS